MQNFAWSSERLFGGEKDFLCGNNVELPTGVDSSEVILSATPSRFFLKSTDPPPPLRMRAILLRTQLSTILVLAQSNF